MASITSCVAGCTTSLPRVAAHSALDAASRDEIETCPSGRDLALSVCPAFWRLPRFIRALPASNRGGRLAAINERPHFNRIPSEHFGVKVFLKLLPVLNDQMRRRTPSAVVSVLNDDWASSQSGAYRSQTLFGRDLWPCLGPSVGLIPPTRMEGLSHCFRTVSTTASWSSLVSGCTVSVPRVAAHSESSSVDFGAIDTWP
jgi:hypothetical protein